MFDQWSGNIILSTQRIRCTKNCICPTLLKRLYKAGCLSCHMQTCCKPDTFQRFFFSEPLPDKPQNRHILFSPFYAELPLISQPNIFYIKIHLISFQVKSPRDYYNPAAFLRGSAMSVFSQVNSGSVLPKCP